MKSIVFCYLLFCCISVSSAQPLDDIVKRRLVKEQKPLAYPALREADILWERRIWRVIDVREKMNQTFAYPEMPLFEIIRQAALQDNIKVYSTEDDRFSRALSKDDLQQVLYYRDTVEVIDPLTQESALRFIEDEINVALVKRFRVKETWFFDEQAGQMRVRILGIAPLVEEYDENDNFKFERPLFWIHYPSSRAMLAQHVIFNPGNDSSLMTWEDLFEMRYFSSYIYKTSNIRNDRLKDYLSGTDRLLEADKIQRAIFNFEHDLWSY